MVGGGLNQDKQGRKKTVQRYGDLHIMEPMEGEESKNLQQCSWIGNASGFKSQRGHWTKEQGFNLEGVINKEKL
jgi:hypothetical protein